MGKKRRVLKRALWSFFPYIPKLIRKQLVRSQFLADYDLPPELTFGIAESAEDIEAAMRIVYEAYISLGYIDGNAHQLRFSKQMALPTTAILVAKWKDEVIGTMSILSDSLMGLPADSTWDLAEYRRNGRKIAEISSLSIKPSFKSKSGGLLLPLCKLMWHYCNTILKYDGIIAAIDFRAEPFYTDLFLFTRISSKPVQNHGLVKGNRSSCLFLATGKQTEALYKRVYNDQPPKKNIYHFMVHASLANIKLPAEVTSSQGYLAAKNRALGQILERYPTFFESLTSQEKLAIANLDAGNMLSVSLFRDIVPNERRRWEVIRDGKIYLHKENMLSSVKIENISESGFMIKAKSIMPVLKSGDSLTLYLSFNDQKIICDASLVWTKENLILGCKIQNDRNGNWHLLISSMQQGVGSQINSVEKKEVC